jgi:hypothetical protein
MNENKITSPNDAELESWYFGAQIELRNQLTKQLQEKLKENGCHLNWQVTPDFDGVEWRGPYDMHHILKWSFDEGPGGKWSFNCGLPDAFVVHRHLLPAVKHIEEGVYSTLIQWQQDPRDVDGLNELIKAKAEETGAEAA